MMRRKFEMSARRLRKYGERPFSVAVVHGGPGAAGEMAPVARRLASSWGVLETLQTATTLDGQVEELVAILEREGVPPSFLIGFSWGAMLSFIVAASRPELVGKLILIGSAPFEERYAASIQQTRMERLGEAEREEAERLTHALEDPGTRDPDAVFARLGELFGKSDAYDPIPNPGEIEPRYDIYRKVWGEAARLRKDGGLLRLRSHIRCPVVAIHGDYDPHPPTGVAEPLSGILSDFRLILSSDCGHKPWIERNARDDFFEVLERELR
jgi:pimeloyl-ACP methyl ester carboxylesterase